MHSGDSAACATRGAAGPACHSGVIRRLVQSSLHVLPSHGQYSSMRHIRMNALVNSHSYDEGHAPMGRLILWKTLGSRVFYGDYPCYFLNFLLRLSKVFGCTDVSILLCPVLP